MTSDDDKARLGERLYGHHDPHDPDGLLTLDDVADEKVVEPDVASDDYPAMPGRHKSTPHQRDNGPI
ncbi:hypothetical protein [Herbiconiux daphne]|uniref:DUF5709 domain-containing protein n=1 Tax=Herbiconiux daphne TaxID=2970914 RepID=A0ABT2H5L5_9MICO|nr:hypothetical protein [Herbiconiux daphne]MCS5735227.1 hypothetical protein [Herbiconiux daphne]